MEHKPVTDSQARKYQLTINNPLDAQFTDKKTGERLTVPFTHDEIKKRVSKLKSIVYWCMGDEIGLKEETPHTHIFFYFSSPVRFSTIKNAFPTAHIEAAYGSCEANRNYITKEGKWKKTEKSETSIEGTFEEFGQIPRNERMGDSAVAQFIYELVENGYSDAEILRTFPESMLYLDKVQRARATLLEDDCKSTWRDLDVTYIFGETNTGKTRSVMERFGYENVYRVTDYKHPFDSYAMQDVILFEEFRDSLPIADMLTYLDGYPCVLPARYANKQAGFTKVFITTNVSLDKQYTYTQEAEPETWTAFLRRIHHVVQHASDRPEDVIDYGSAKQYMAKLTEMKRVFRKTPKRAALISDNDFENMVKILREPVPTDLSGTPYEGQAKKEQTKMEEKDYAAG